ncbi:hypothetical protein ACS0TY_008580 [Phlomoides rotata]
MAFSGTIVLFFQLLHFSQTTCVKFTFVNNCWETIWPVTDGSKTPANTGLQLSRGNSFIFEAAKGWSGRFWGKTGCTFDSISQVSCHTGDCSFEDAGCNITGVTLVEFTLAIGDNNDFYDVSLVNGFNLPVLVQPSGGSGQCAPTGCPKDLNRLCPPELRTRDGACLSTCTAFNTTGDCCTGEYDSPATCKPSNYTRVFKEACPQAYAYPYDDPSNIFTCINANYFITFCPANHSFLSPLQSPAYPPHNAGGYRTTKNGSKKIIFIVLVPLGVITSLVTASIAIYFFVKRQQPSPTSKKCKEDIENFLLQYGSLAPKRYKYSEIKKITKSFSDELGKGGYDSVYKGGLHDGSLVAVKVLMETDSNGEEFMNEVASISRTSHVNVVTLLGFCYEGEKRALVYEFMPNKSLDKFLRKSREAGDTDCVLDLQKLYKIAVGISRGLEYLHMGCSTRIVHFDIKPHNILLDDDLCPKISDFGLAKLCKKKQSELSVFGTRGTIGYIAPEMFSRNFGGVSHKSDVYSYGMMVLEMAGARERFEAHVNQSSENYFPDKLYEEVTIDMTNKLDDFKIGDDEEETRKKIFLIGFWCIQTNLSDRPSMLEGCGDVRREP